MDFTDFIESLNRKYDNAYEAYCRGDYDEECHLINQGIGMKEAFLLIFGEKYDIKMNGSQGKSNHTIVEK